MPTVNRVLLNFVVFQIAWFAAVLGAANGMPVPGVVAVAIAIAMHLTMATSALPELKLIACCAAVGFVFDSVLVAAGWVSYPSGMLIDFAAPYWIVAMWMLFATTLNVSLKWLKPHKWLGAVFGLAGGPLAYFSGSKLGAIQLDAEWTALGALAIGWAIAVPILLHFADRLNGFVDAARLSGSALAARG